MKLYSHQTAASIECTSVLSKYGLAYVYGKPRVGKSLIALESAKTYGKAIVFTKKSAINGWLKYGDSYDFDVTNYEQIEKINITNYDIVIIDEAHNFSALPKPSLRTKVFRQKLKDKIIIFLSGTPLIEGSLRIYPQLSLSSFSPFNHYKNFYAFFRDFGISEKIRLAGYEVETYKKANDKAIESIIEPYIVRVDDSVFKHNNIDKVEFVEAPESFYKLIKYIKNQRMIGDIELDTVSAVQQCLHQIEGGIYKGRKLKDTPKLDWLKAYVEQHLNEKICIMSYFVDEQKMLGELFRLSTNVEVLSSTKYCEGVDLSHFEHYVLYSFGYSGAKFVQLRDRIVNLNKKKDTFCVIPIIKRSLGGEVYKIVNDKKAFNKHHLEGFLQKI